MDDWKKNIEREKWKREILIEWIVKQRKKESERVEWGHIRADRWTNFPKKILKTYA